MAAHLHSMAVDGEQVRSDIARLAQAARADESVARRIDELIANGTQVVDSTYDRQAGCLRLRLTRNFANLLARPSPDRRA